MNVASLFLHNQRNSPCPAWTIRNANGEEIAKINATLSKYMAYQQNAMFNEWLIWSDGSGHFGAKRFTWETIWHGTLDEILARFEEYYRQRF